MHNVIITGVGGQGNVLSSQLLGQALVGKGYFVTIGETYGASQRGGSVMSHIRVSDKKQLSPLIPKGKADIVVGLEPVEALRVLTAYGNPETVVISNTRPIYPVDVTSGDEKYPEAEDIQKALEDLSSKLYFVPATEKAMEMGSSILGNMIMVGALLELRMLPLTREDFGRTLEKTFKGQRLEINLRALEEGGKSLAQVSRSV
ncbi:MAG TPA: indolepyruvate oxidoreductase subunit beta [Thermodesulfobacteriota bacterium]|nr:indolepyruvate oxidoreductase subunit beta [Thermodesulfobacteriota bacterium]